MQLIPRYLVDDKIFIISNDTGFTTEYRPVYTRQVKIYKGIDNKIQFRLLNADQKPILITDAPVFVAFDEENNQLILKNCVVQDDGSTRDSKGTFYVEITENELLNVKQQYLKYNIYLDGNERTLTYADRNFEAAGTIYIDGNAFPGPKSSTLIERFYATDSTWYAGNDSVDQINAAPGLNGNEALHSAAIYSNGYIGNIHVQATLDNQITGQNNWTTLQTITFDGTETQPVPANFNGVFTYIRFEADANPTDKITKILVRN